MSGRKVRQGALQRDLIWLAKILYTFRIERACSISKSTENAPAPEGGDATDVDFPWDDDNQAWWDWYLTLAENDGEGAGDLLDGPPALDAAPADDAGLAAALAEPYALTGEDVAFFRENGFVKLKSVLGPSLVARLREEIRSVLERAFALALDDRASGRFLSAEMAWLEARALRMFVLSPRIAGIAAKLIGAPAVRLYHDNLLSKEPGGGRTPWHYDDHHFPLATDQVATAWIPAQPIPREMGPLAFAGPIDVWRLVKDVPFDRTNTSYDRRVAEIFRERDVAVEDGPFEVGEVSFHHNLSFHTAAANRTRKSRVVLANTYFADGARLVDRPTMVSGDWRKFLPDVEPGGVAASPLNPICWPPQPASPFEPRESPSDG